MEKIRLVCATRATQSEFFSTTALGKSLSLFDYVPAMELRLFCENSAGLPSVYNLAIDEARADPAVLVFVHDDVYLNDFYWPWQVFEAMKVFDIVGVAGCTCRVPGQPSWAFRDAELSDVEQRFLSGAVGHGKGFPCDKISAFGGVGQDVKLLDGLLLVSRSRTLIDNGIGFDERFDFNFYDMDFCRAAEAKALRMGTWPISLIHESGGHFGTAAWWSEYRKYLEKWNETGS